MWLGIHDALGQAKLLGCPARHLPQLALDVPLGAVGEGAVAPLRIGEGQADENDGVEICAACDGRVLDDQFHRRVAVRAIGIVSVANADEGIAVAARQFQRARLRWPQALDDMGVRIIG